MIMTARVPKIRTVDLFSQVTPVPNSDRTPEQNPMPSAVLFSHSRKGEQREQGSLDERLERIRAAKAERAADRAEFARRRAYGVAARHKAKLARNASRRRENGR